MAKDNRIKPRVFIRKEVIINDRIRAYAIDISEEGMYIYSQQSFKKDEIIDMRFAEPQNDLPESFRAKVLYTQGGVGFGVFFMDISPHDRERLRWFVERHLDKTSQKGRKAHKKMILFIDDSEQVRMRFKCNLLMKGYSVMEAENGLEAIKLLSEDIPDMIILELSLQGIDGYRVLQVIRTHESWKDLPVIVLTSSPNPEEMEKAVAIGIDDYLIKMTTTPKKLAEKVEEVFNKRGV